MVQETIRCVEPALYTSQYPGSTFEEARAILIGMYAEKELIASLEDGVRKHLERCDCCTLFLKRLSDTGEFNIPAGTITVAVCPSSRNLDAYVHDRSGISTEEAGRITSHLEDCPLCKEEIDWLKKLDRPIVIDFPGKQRNWIQVVFIAAAFFFFALSVALLLQRSTGGSAEAQLAAIAEVKQPEQINFELLLSSAPSLPEETNAMYLRAVQHLKSRNYQEAAGMLEKVIAASPDHSGAVYLLGYTFYQLNQLEKAFELCDRAEQMQPHSMERCLSLVHIALKTGHYGRAIQEISGLHHEAPNHPEVTALYQRITAITKNHTIGL